MQSNIANYLGEIARSVVGTILFVLARPRSVAIRSLVIDRAGPIS